MDKTQGIIRTFPAQEPIPLTITAEDIARYAELSVLVSQLEAQQKTVRAELLAPTWRLSPTAWAARGTGTQQNSGFVVFSASALLNLRNLPNT